MGTNVEFDPRIHAVAAPPRAGGGRGQHVPHHAGQRHHLVAQGLRPDPGRLHAALLAPGARREPGRHRATCRRVVEIEMDSATATRSSSPTPGSSCWAATSTASPSRWPRTTSCMAAAELANISERRIERLVNPQLSGLPAFLVTDSGLNSGFMIAQYTAAALVSENKVLSHPASVDSIPTSANKEDHVSMGTIAARKCRAIVGNTRERPRHRAAVRLPGGRPPHEPAAGGGDPGGLRGDSSRPAPPRGRPSPEPGHRRGAGAHALGRHPGCRRAAGRAPGVTAG